MVSPETLEQNSSGSNMTLDQQQQTTSPRISFSSELLEDANFISINLKNHEKNHNHQQEQTTLDNKNRTTTRTEFDFLTCNSNAGVHQTMLTADELFFEGKLLPFWKMHHYTERLSKISIQNSNRETGQEAEEVMLMDVVKTNANTNGKTNKNPSGEDQELPRMSSGSSNDDGGVSWFVDDDPSPRPPKCTVLWKELLRLKKQQRAASTLSPSSSSSSTSSSSSSLSDVAAAEVKEKTEKRSDNANKRVKKGLEKARSASIRIRPMVNVPICAHQVRTSSTKSSTTLPPLFPLGLNKKGRSIDR